MPIPDFILDTSIDLDAMAQEKLDLFQDAVIKRVDELDAELQARLQVAYSGGVVHQVTGKAARSVEAIPAVAEGRIVKGSVQAGGGTAPYVKGLEDGTPAHVIMPKNAQALSFLMGGERVFFKKVNHPGTQAYHIMESTFDAMEDEIITALKALPSEVFGS